MFLPNPGLPPPTPNPQILKEQLVATMANLMEKLGVKATRR